MSTRFPLLALFAALGCAATYAESGAAGDVATPPVSAAVDGWNFNLPGPELAKLCQDTIAQAQADFTAIENDESPATLASVFGAYDAMHIGLQRIQHTWYVQSVHPDADIRAAAEQCVKDYMDFTVAIDLSPAFYRRVAAIETGALQAPEQLMVENKLRAFRKAGVDRDDKTRQQVRQILNEITELGTQFDRNIREDTRYLKATAEQLRGLPEDFLASHPADENGLRTISTDYPDYMPVMQYAEDDAFRRELLHEFLNIATPANTPILKALIEKRHELALLLGYSSWAEMAMDGMMIENPGNAQSFLVEVGDAVRKPAAQDLSILLQRLRQIDPQAQDVQQWQASYLSNLVKQEQYAIDAREIREYFHFERVQAGIFQLTEDLFGVQIIPWQTPTWHDDVTAWEMRDDGEAIGRFYLDLHPRKDKYKHAAHWTLRTGLRDRQVPLSGMAMNFPRGKMEHQQVETFLHEFGHLLHNMFSGTQPWLDISGMSMERDFVEAPSQMLEEWVWDYDTVSRFAVNDAGQTIPRSLMDKMVKARHFGEAAGTARQIYYANLSLNYYSRDPASFELLPLMKDIEKRYSPYPHMEGTHFFNKFGHLNGYSSNYYIYQWSKSISTAMMERFRAQGLRNPKVAKDYRDKVLAPGGSRHARDMVEDFIGRPYTTEAYKKYLETLH